MAVSPGSRELALPDEQPGSGTLRVRPPFGRRDGRRLSTTLLVSAALHAAAVAALLLLLHTGASVDQSAIEPPQVELVMVEHKGDLVPPGAQVPSPPTASAAGLTPRQASGPAGSAAPTRSSADPQAAAAREAPAADMPPIAEPADGVPMPSGPGAAAGPSPAERRAQTVTPSAAASSVPADNTAPLPQKPGVQAPVAPSATVQAQQAQSEPTPATATPPTAPPAPKISLSGTDSPSEARAWGDRIIPAAPSAVFHNRPPEYPIDAAMKGERGTVVVLVHVSPAGTAAGVDLLRSSGYVLLDSAAQQAVMRWRFLPAVKNGRPVASDMQMGFQFTPD